MYFGEVAPFNLHYLCVNYHLHALLKTSGTVFPNTDLPAGE